ncbi:MAG: hemolysin family protein [Muribaculaceae bacterium]|nr:hemolysin family protein [Muribaculaceae bacterium]
MDDILIICGLILLNGIFSMSEVALISARKTKLSADAKKGYKGAAVALSLSEDPERFLSTVQIGITLIGILTGLFSGATIADDFGNMLMGWGVGASVAEGVSKVFIVSVVTYLSIVVGELVPKKIGMSMADTIARLVAPGMKLLSVITYPLVWILSVSTSYISRILRIDKRLSVVTEDEIRSLIKEGAEGGEVKEVEQDIMERALVLGDLRVDSIMTVRGEVVSMSLNMTSDDVKCLISRELHSSYPVYDSSKSEIIGIVSLKQLILSLNSDSFSLEDNVMPGLYVPENMSVYDVLDMFKKRKAHSALVCDEYGGFCGVVTLRDILDGLVGSCPDEVEEPMIVKRDSIEGWLVDGRCPVYDFLSYFDKEELYEPRSYATLGGMIMNHLQRVAVTGDVVEWNGFRMEVVVMDNARVGKVAVTV